MSIYEQKYKKYKSKYLDLKLHQGGKFDSINNLINFFKKWDNPNYQGMNLFDSRPRSTYENLISYKTNIDIKQVPQIHLPDNLNLSKFKPNVDGITEFLNSFNFIESKKFSFANPTFYRIEGSSGEHLQFHNNIITQMSNKPIKYIMEIGFNAGISAINFLEKTKDINTIVVSFDLMLHDYCWYAKMFIDNKYPGRHMLISGDSALQVKTFSLISEIKFDLIFIDGDHNYESAYLDIINCKNLSHKDTIVILDNVAPHAGCGIGPYVAMNRAIKEGVIKFVNHFEITDYKDGFATLKYNHEQNEKHDDVKPDYRIIERLVPTYSLTEVLGKIKITPELKNSVQIILDYFKKYNIKIDSALQTELNKIM